MIDELVKRQVEMIRNRGAYKVCNKGVPPLRVCTEISDKVLGDDFKFHDWFSLTESPRTLPELPNQAASAEH